MSRNATASWSGYSHQGKIGLLVTLSSINSLYASNPSFSDYTLEYESQEDVVLKHLNQPFEVHQVKAHKGSTTIGSYTTALRDFEACPGNNFLHAICTITNWGSLTAAQNPHSVSRYTYPDGNNYCSLSQIDNLLDDQIQELLNNAGHAERNNGNWRRECLFNFLGVLDERIRLEHQTKIQANYDISFSLDEVISIIRDRTISALSRLHSIREKLYQAYVMFIDELENNEIAISTDQEKFVILHLQTIYGLADKEFDQFLRDINPHTT